VTVETSVYAAEISTVGTSDPERKEVLLHPDLHSRMASERLKDDHGGLEPEGDGTPTLEPETITIRPLQAGDDEAVARLAELEERPVPQGALLVAEVDGSVEAAIGLDGCQTVANPFAASSAAVTLLHVRAVQLRAA
jgi:hypothetical protein